MMGLLYISIFLSGMMTVGFAIWAYRVYIEKRDHRQEVKKRRAAAEENGWIKTKGLTHWSNRNKMEQWRKEIKDDLEISIWMEENIKGYFKVEYIYGDRYIKFTEDEDGVAFKLRWS